MRGKALKYLFLLCLVVPGFFSYSQNQHSKWYFGQKAALDFMTDPPTVLNNSQVMTTFASSSVADAAGNLLFYTDGDTIWNSAHAVMANGTGITTNVQNAIIVKQPASSIYYVFSVGYMGAAFGFSVCYSKVDMSMAAGMGSVTVKNVTLSTNCVTGLAAVKHCNGQDYWLVAHDFGSNNYRSYLVTSAGLNTTAVISSAGPTYTSYGWSIKISPTGKKLVSLNNPPQNCICDIDASTGVISNATLFGFPFSQAFDFSPNGSKLYVRDANSILQLDLCAASMTAMAATAYTMTATYMSFGMTLAPNGKIYVARGAQQFLGVINNPDVAGAGCNYVNLGQSVAPGKSAVNTPLFAVTFDHPPPAAFSSTVNNAFGCQGVAFQSNLALPCQAVSYSLTGMQWDFGDPLSGPANTSNLSNPMHFFTSQGTYTVKLIYNYSCGGKTDTLKQVVNVNQPCIAISSSISCASLGSATVSGLIGTGPFSYTWLPTNQTGTLATGLSPGSYTLKVFAAGSNNSYSTVVALTPSVPLTITVASSPSVGCAGAANATANITGINGGSGSQTYLWNNGASTYTNAAPANLGAGSWTVTVTDALTGCKAASVFVVTQPPPLTLSLSASSPTACVNRSITLSGSSSGGTPAYSYAWAAGPATSSCAISQSLGGAFVYTLSSADLNGCTASGTISVSFVPNPTVAISPPKPVVCLGEKITLTASGSGQGYTWAPVLTLSSHTGAAVNASPQSQQGYTVTTSLNTCTGSAIITVSVLPLPAPLAEATPWICLHGTIVLKGSGGQSYLWESPDGQSSGGQTATFVASSNASGGIYTLTVSDANGCKNATTMSVTIISGIPTGTLGGRMSGCVPFCSDFKFAPSSINLAPITSQSWRVEEAGFGSDSFAHCFKNAGERLLVGTLKDENGCVNTMTYVVSAYPVPRADFTWLPEKPVEGFDEVQFTDASHGENIGRFNWYFISNLGHTGKGKSAAFLFASQGTYPVAYVVRNQWGCADSVVKAVKIEPDFNFFVPNAFTPNADGRNEVFMPVMRGVKLFHFCVFNRWGQLLFETHEQGQGWSGAFNGNLCQDGVYVWKISLSSTAGEAKEYKGHVTLMRGQ